VSKNDDCQCAGAIKVAVRSYGKKLWKGTPEEPWGILRKPT